MIGVLVLVRENTNLKSELGVAYSDLNLARIASGPLTDNVTPKKVDISNVGCRDFSGGDFVNVIYEQKTGVGREANIYKICLTSEHSVVTKDLVSTEGKIVRSQLVNPYTETELKDLQEAIFDLNLNFSKENEPSGIYGTCRQSEVITVRVGGKESTGFRLGNFCGIGSTPEMDFSTIKGDVSALIALVKGEAPELDKGLAGML